MLEEPKYFIAMFSPSRETFPGDAKPEEIAIIQEHFDQFKADQARGLLVIAGRTLDHNPLGMCIFKAESQQAAEKRINEDAAIKSGVFVLQCVRPYAVALFGAP